MINFNPNVSHIEQGTKLNGPEANGQTLTKRQSAELCKPPGLGEGFAYFPDHELGSSAKTQARAPSSPLTHSATALKEATGFALNQGKLAISSALAMLKRTFVKTEASTQRMKDFLTQNERFISQEDLNKETNTKEELQKIYKNTKETARLAAKVKEGMHPIGQFLNTQGELRDVSTERSKIQHLLNIENNKPNNSRLTQDEIASAKKVYADCQLAFAKKALEDYF